MKRVIEAFAITESGVVCKQKDSCFPAIYEDRDEALKAVAKAGVVREVLPIDIIISTQ